MKLNQEERNKLKEFLHSLYSPTSDHSTNDHKDFWDNLHKKENNHGQKDKSDRKKDEIS
jgi:hypothetical protein